MLPLRSSLIATRDQGRLHIAYEACYQGSINSYNNCISRFFMKLFGLACDLTVNSKTYCVNKKSYSKFLLNHGFSHPGAENSLPSTLQGNFTVRGDLGFLRDHLSEYKQEKRFQKLVLATFNRDERTALKMVCKGARVNDSFLLFEQTIYFTNDVHDIPFAGHAIAKTPVTGYTPFLYAVDQHLTTLALTLLQFGANDVAWGRRFTFERTILSSQLTQHTESHISETIEVKAGAPPKATPIEVKETVTNQIITYQDTISNRVWLHCYPGESTVTAEKDIMSGEEISSKIFTTQAQVGRTRV